MINKRTKKTNNLHLVIISLILLSQYVLHPVFVSIKIITNKRTDKGDCLHFAIISPSFFFKILYPVFISIKIITNKKEQTKMTCLHFAIVSPSFFFEVLHPVFTSINIIITKEQTKVTAHILQSYHLVLLNSDDWQECWSQERTPFPSAQLPLLWMEGLQQGREPCCILADVSPGNSSNSVGNPGNSARGTWWL